MSRLLPYIAVTTFLLVAVFGVFLTAPVSHDTVCPFSGGCVTELEHIAHWQSAFAAIVAEILVLLAFVAVFFISTTLSAEIAHFSLWRERTRVPLRPPLLQELFSQGILHRKEPQIA